MGAGVRLIAYLSRSGAAALLLAVSGCDGASQSVPTGGDPKNGRLLLQQYGCGSCHRIPGVANAQGNVGPSLEAVGSRIYLAGILPATAPNMMRWIQAPHEVDPLTTMPDLQVPEPHARDMTAYLFTLR